MSKTEPSEANDMVNDMRDDLLTHIGDFGGPDAAQPSEARRVLVPAQWSDGEDALVCFGHGIGRVVVFDDRFEAIARGKVTAHKDYDAARAAVERELSAVPDESWDKLKEAAREALKFTGSAEQYTKKTYHEGGFDGINHWSNMDEIATLLRAALAELGGKG